MSSEKIGEKGLGELAGAIKRQFGCILPDGFDFYGKKEKHGKKIFAFSGDRLPKVPASWIGVHFGTLMQDGFQPSIEGAIMLGEKATKNVFEVGVEEARRYFDGGDITLPAHADGTVLLAAQNNVFAPAQASGAAAENILPKSRKTTALL